MLECYFDDSGTHQESKVVTWGGLMGTAVQWRFLDRSWKKLLAEPLPGRPPIKQFHLSHCAALDGEFATYKRAESDRLRFLFRKIIADARLEAVGYSVVIGDYDSLVRGSARQFLGTPEEVAFAGCVNRAANRAKELGHGFLSMTFDQGRIQPGLQCLIDKVRTDYQGPPHLVAIDSMAVADATALQAADTVATENNWNVKDLIDDPNAQPRPHHLSMITSLEEVAGFVLDRQHMLELRKSLPYKHRNGIRLR